MKKLLIAFAMFIGIINSAYSQNQENYDYKNKIISFLEEKYSDRYSQLELINKIISVSYRLDNKNITETLGGIKKNLLIEIIIEEKKVQEVILGKTRQGREIKAFYRGNPNREFVLFVGNIHGGYEYGSFLTTQELRKKLEQSNKKQWMIIETLNPDGLQEYFERGFEEKYYLEGRANSNGVDLNRNFCTKSYTSGSYIKDDIELFTGKFCGQEREVKIIEELLASYKFSSLVDIHSAGGILFIPENSFGDSSVIEFANRIDEILDLKYYFKSSFIDENEKLELVKKYEIDSNGEGEFTGTLITYFYEKTGRPAILIEMWGHGIIEDTILNLVDLVE